MPNLTYPGPDNIHRRRLPNGITVLVYENFASQSVVVEGVVHAGALVEPRDRAGLAHLTAELLMRGTASRSFAQIYEALEAVGASLGFSGGRNATEFSGRGLVEDLPLLLDLLAESLRRPTFPEAQLAQVQGQILTGLQIRANDTRRMAGLAFRELLYGDHPYGQSITGYEGTVSALGRREVVDFHRNYYGPEGMLITLVGAIETSEALAQVEAVLGDWRNEAQRPSPPIPDVPRPPHLQQTYVPLPDKSQSDLIMGLPGPRRAAPDYLDAKLMNTILGVFGMMGRIGKNVRQEQGLAYYAYSRLRGGLGPSPWYACAGVAPGDVERAMTSIRREIDRIQQEPVPAEELADSQAFATGSMPVGLETNSGLAGVITDMAYYGLGLDYLQRYPDMIDEITPARIQAAAQKYLSSEQLAVAVSGPAREGA
jgi:zinc protease